MGGRSRTRMRLMTQTLRIAVVTTLIALVGAACPVSSREKTDTVTLANGDHLTGEIKKLEYGRLRLKTDSMDNVYIEWDEIVSVTSEFFYEIELKDGTRYYGSLAEPEAENTLRIVLGVSPLDVSKPEVVKIEPIKTTFWKRVDGSLKAGFSYTKSSDVAQINFGFDATHRARKFRNDLSANTIITTKPEDETSRRFDTSYTYSRFLKHRYTAFGNSSMQSNDELNLDLRLLFSGGVGRAFIQTNRNTLGAQVGLAVNREWRGGEDPNDISLEAVLTADYRFFQYSSPKSDINVSLQLFPSITDWGRYRMEFNTKFRREMITDFFLDIDIYYSFDNRESAEGAANEDYGTILGLSWTF
jgi:hypothetical protein